MLTLTYNGENNVIMKVRYKTELFFLDKLRIKSYLFIFNIYLNAT
jgi:hypothetical protein